MKPMREPVRWLDPASDATDELRRLLAAGRPGPGDDEWRRLESFVGGLGAAGTAGAGGSAASVVKGAAILKSAAFKVGVLTLVGGGAAVGAWSVATRGPSEKVAVTAAGTSTESRAVPRPMSPRVGASTATPLPIAPAASPAVPAPEPTAETSGSVPRAPAAGAPRLVLGTLPSAEALPGAAAESELGLLTRARGLVGVSPEAALRVVAEHRARFPHGVFEQEREVLAIEALAKLGRTAEARARASEFTVAFPASAHARRIRVLLGDDPDEK